MSEDLENVDQPDETPVTGRRLSRRTMIAGTAGAAAAMWAAPAVTSLAPRAFAQSPVRCGSGQTFCPGSGCVNLTNDKLNCGECGNVCPPSSDLCFVPVCFFSECTAFPKRCPAGEACNSSTGACEPET